LGSSPEDSAPETESRASKNSTLFAYPRSLKQAASFSQLANNGFVVAGALVGESNDTASYFRFNAEGRQTSAGTATLPWESPINFDCALTDGGGLRLAATLDTLPKPTGLIHAINSNGETRWAASITAGFAPNFDRFDGIRGVS